MDKENSNAYFQSQQHRVSQFARRENSIAAMSAKKPTPTPESRAIKAAIDASGMKQKDVAALVGVEPSMVSQWVTGARPVPADKAPLLARAIAYQGEIGALSVAYRGVYAAQGSGGAVRRAEMTGDLRDMGLIVSRLENDVHALNLALGVLVGVMKTHRPAEAAVAENLLRRLTPPRNRGKGLMGELLEALDTQPPAK